MTGVSTEGREDFRNRLGEILTPSMSDSSTVLSKAQEETIKHILFKNPESFYHWAQSHQSLIKKSPILSQIEKIANSSSEKTQSVVETHHIFADKNVQEFADQIELFALNLIQGHQLLQGENIKILSNPSFSSEIQSIFSRLPPSKALELLSKLTPNGKTLLTDSEFQPLGLFLLKVGLNGSTDKQIISFLSSKDQNNNTPLHVPEVIKELTSFLKNLDTKERNKLLLSLNKERVTPLSLAFYHKIFDDETVFSLFGFHMGNDNDIPSKPYDEMYTLRGETKRMKDWILSKLGNPDEFNAVLNFAEMLDYEDAHSLVLYGTNPEQKTSIYEALNIKRFLSIFKFHDSLPLYPFSDKKLLLEILVKKEGGQEEVVKWLLKKNAYGIIKFHAFIQSPDLPLLLDVLKNLDPKNIITLFSSQNGMGNTPLFDYDVFEKIIDYLKVRLTSEQIKDLLSIKNNQGLICLHDRGVLFRAFYEGESPLFDSDILEPKHIQELLLIHDPRGKNILQYAFFLSYINNEFIKKIFDVDFNYDGLMSSAIETYNDEIHTDPLGYLNTLIDAWISQNSGENRAKAIDFALKLGAYEVALIHLLSNLPYAEYVDKIPTLQTVPPVVILNFLFTPIETNVRPIDIPKIVGKILQWFGPILTIRQLCTSLETHSLPNNQTVFWNGVITKNITNNELKNTLDIDFDLSKIPNHPQHPEKLDETALKDGVIQWVNEHEIGAERAKALLLPGLLGYTQFVNETLETLFREEREVLYNMIDDDPQAIHLSKLLEKSKVRDEHLFEGLNPNAIVPKPISMDTVVFHTNAAPKKYEEFYSFLPDLINGAIVEGHRSGFPLDVETTNLLRDLEIKIRTNEFVFGMSQDNESERREQYRVFCSYLTHIVTAYKLGQAGGDSEVKREILTNIAEISKVCYPAWMKEIALYYCGIEEGSEEKVVFTMKDRVLGRLRTERMYIISVKMLMYDERVHEPNYLLDITNNDLGLQLKPINDPFNPWYSQNYPKSKEEILQEFNKIYNREDIIDELFVHINSQHTAEKLRKSLIDLAPREIIEWLTEREAVYWRKEEYDSIQKNALKMESEGVPVQQIEKYLSRYGIDWKEDSVEDGLNKLQTKQESVSVINVGRTNFKAFFSIEDFFRNHENNPSIEAKENFIRRYPQLGLDPNDNQEQMKAKLHNWKEKQEKLGKNLDALHKQIESLSTEKEKKEILVKHGFIHPKPSLETVVETSAIREAQINKFFDDIVYRDTPDQGKVFTKEGVFYLLKSVGFFDVTT